MQLIVLLCVVGLALGELTTFEKAILDAHNFKRVGENAKDMKALVS
jgi:hypothetical protein